MPRRPRIRTQQNGAPLQVDEEWRLWLSHWKEWAIGRVPASASPATRSAVRQAVERALMRLGPEDPEPEVRDVVEAVLEPIVQDLADRAAREARERRRRESLDQVETCLEVALLLRPGPRTTAMLGRPDYTKAVLIERLRRRWRRELTGDESAEEIIESMLAFVDHCLAKQPPPPRRWGSRIAQGTLVTAQVTAQVLAVQPELRDLATIGLAAGRDKLRALITRLSGPKPPTS